MDDPVQQAPLRIAYILLWFPLSSETFIFREIEDLRRLGVEITVYTMYGKALKGCSQAMHNYSGPIVRMGAKASWQIASAFFSTFFKQPRLVLRLLRKCFFRRMRNCESQLENMWCFMAGFLLARLCVAANMKLIHSAWANGPATAAWVASKLSGIPFAFTGRAGDIYPPDGLLTEKSADALFIRANNRANVNWLASFCPEDKKSKVRLVYNGLTFPDTGKCEEERKEPQAKRILAVGRFARTKGFPDLLTALARLRRENMPVELTLIGDGAWRRRLEKLRKRLNLEDCAHMPGFIPNDEIKKHMLSHAVLVVPSVIHTNGDRDGIPNVIMEALSLGMPVVATDVCGISEVIENGVTGLLTPQRKPAVLARAIRQQLENWPKATSMGLAGCKRVREMFDPVKNSVALKKLYEEAIRANG